MKMQPIAFAFPQSPGVVRAILITIASALVMSGCTTDPVPGQTAAERKELQQEFEHLNNLRAFDEAEAVLKEWRAVHGGAGEAAYAGAFLAVNRALEDIAGILLTINVVSQTGISPAAQPGSITPLVHNAFEKVREIGAELNAVLTATASTYPEDSVSFDQFNLFVGPVLMGGIAAEVDRTDLSLFKAVTSLLVMAVSDIVLTVEFGVRIQDVFDVIDWVKEHGECQPSFLANGECILKLSAWALNQYPDLLTLARPEGQHYSQKLLMDVRNGLQAAVDIVELGQAEADPQDDDWIVVLPPGSTDSESVREGQLGIGFRNAFLTDWNQHFGETMLEGRTFVTRVHTAGPHSETVWGVEQSSVAHLEAAVEHLRGGGEPIDVNVLLRPLVDTLGQMAIELSDLDTSELSAEMRPEAAETGVGQIELASLAVQALDTILPPGLAAIDLHQAFTAPVGLRSVLPHSDFVRAQEEENEPMLAVDWDCSFREVYAYAGGTCARRPVDGARFAGTTYELSADGIAERTPYIGFRQPDFGGTLKINVAKAPTTDVSVALPASPAGLRKPTQQTLNFVVHRIWEKVIDVFFE